MIESQNPEPELTAKDIDLVTLTRGILRAMKLDNNRSQLSEKLLDNLANGGTLSDLYGLTSDDLEAVYGMARTLYKNQKYDDALTMFRFLCYLDHMEKKYWMGLGATQQMLKKYDEALKGYGMCTVVDIDDPRPQIQAGFCLIQMGHKEEAIAALEGAILSADATEVTNLQARALLAKVNAEPAAADA